VSDLISNFNKRDFSNFGKSNVLNSNAMLASSHPLASSVGLEILKSGGNAVDAALAMNGVLCVALRIELTSFDSDVFWRRPQRYNMILCDYVC